MKFIRAVITLLLSLLLAVSVLNGCSTDDDYVLYFELDAQPFTLDPQLASGTAEELLVRNLFEGLTRLDHDGNVVEGTAEAISVSEDGLVYTFTISNQAVWSNGDPVTAEDYVFAFTRAVDPVTAAPNASALFGIENAEEINTGKPSGGLGVKAHGERQLEIRLTDKNPHFLQLLTMAVCMPCHRETFEQAKGKYGLDADHFLSNGSFKLRSWTKGDSFSLRLNQNPEYAGRFPADAMAVIFSRGEIAGRAARLERASLDIGFIDPAEAGENSGIFLFEKTCYALVINKNAAIGEEKFRRAFEMSIHRSRLEEELSKAFAVSDILLPDAVTLSGKPLAEQCSVTSPLQYDPAGAHNLYLQGVKAAGDPGATSILYCGNETVTKVAELVAESMQQSLGTVVNLKKAESESALLTAMADGEYTLAIVPITAQSAEPKQFLTKFRSSNTGSVFGFASSDFDKEVNRITAASDSKTVTEATENALNILAADHSVIPLVCSLEALGYSGAYSCPVASPFNGVIDLALVTRKE